MASEEGCTAIECYFCKQAGHLCCAENKEKGPNEASCYSCGQSDHYGLECTKSNVNTFDVKLLCHKCKERDHSPKQCPREKARSAKRIEKRKKFFASRKKDLKKKNLKQTPTLLPAVAGPLYSGSTTNGEP